MSTSFRIRTSRDGTRQINEVETRIPHSFNKTQFKNSRNNNNHNNNSKKHANTNFYGGDVRRNDVRRNNGRSNVFARVGFPLLQQNAIYSKSNWFEVRIENGKNYEKDFILRSIEAHSTEKFVPINFRIKNQSVFFNVFGQKEAAAIEKVNRKITTQDNHKMIIHVSPSGPQYSKITPEIKSKIKEVMGKRFDPARGSLDLSNFAESDDFLLSHIFLAMDRERLASVILDTIAENIPNIKILDLSHNKLNHLGMFSSLSEKAPNITHLNLSNNRISLENDLDIIRRLQLEELILEATPLKTNLSKKQSYVKNVRRFFPKVLKLDGNELPKPIDFKIETTELPPILGNYLGDEIVQSKVVLFIQQYFGLYDSNDREQLIGAYHEEAMFSLSCSNDRNVSDQESYRNHNRNLKRISDAEKLKRVKVGRSDIISLLKTLPATNHKLDSFVLDVSYVTASILIFSVEGVFLEGSQAKRSIRQFSWTVLAVPNGEGIAIKNEMRTVFNASQEITKKYREEKKAELNPTTSSAPVASAPAVPAEALTVHQKEMIVLFSQQSGMNAKYSELCLAENGWDFDKSAQLFTELMGCNRIPPEAFVP